MEFLSKKLVKSEDLERKIKIVCSYNGAKCEFIQGKIIDVKDTNISFIEPHKVVIKNKNYAIMLIYYDNDNMFLYDRTMKLTFKKLEKILQTLKQASKNV